ACSSSTLRGDLRDLCTGGLSPGRIRIGNLCLSACRSSCPPTRPDGQAIAADSLNERPRAIYAHYPRCPQGRMDEKADNDRHVRILMDECLARLHHESLPLKGTTVQIRLVRLRESAPLT